MPVTQPTKSEVYTLEEAEDHIADARGQFQQALEAFQQDDTDLVPNTPALGATQFSASGHQKYVSSDGSVANTGHVIGLVTSPTLFNSTSDAEVPGTQLLVSAITYLIRGQMIFDSGFNAGNARFSFHSSTTASTIRVEGLFWQDTGAGIALNGANTTSITGQMVSQTLSSTNRYVLTFDGWVTFAGAGWVDVMASCSNATDTFTVRATGSYLELVPVT